MGHTGDTDAWAHGMTDHNALTATSGIKTQLPARIFPFNFSTGQATPLFLLAVCGAMYNVTRTRGGEATFPLTLFGVCEDNMKDDVEDVIFYYYYRW